MMKFTYEKKEGNMMILTYDKVKNDMWEIIKNKTDFIYKPSSDCDVCIDRNEWDYDSEGWDYEPPLCREHYDQDACRYFYADEYGTSDYNTPACVVGNWFTYAEFTPQDLNVTTWEELEGQGVRTILERAHFDIDEDTFSFLNLLQTHQDTGISWGNAYEMAVAKVEGNDE